MHRHLSHVKQCLEKKVTGRIRMGLKLRAVSSVAFEPEEESKKVA